ncbi:DEAD/DEAH box helicase [Roseateles sp. SL47]|uniref:DEAD/DEAH box helicase n=1 Tax=Roseateles sp. SL47 TaxID=2995138 RepID=UPI0022709F83|nr:DEAD/DEAH box helicase [Roseateles sp. SL47]WAC74804.1 DEAD/DEAH box helicase [Roseateles sp. SL47]
MSTFASLGLSPRLQQAAQELGFDEPTPIQAAALGPALAGQDLQASAETGSGKTAAYAFPLMQQIDAGPRPALRRTRALVLVPTRELAVQVGELLRQLSPYLAEPVKVAVLFGGVSINPQLMALRGGAEVVVATPGRLLDVVDHNGLKLSELSTLVLDEADRLLDGAFADEVQRVLSLLPGRRQTLLFSATFAETVQQWADQLLRQPVRIEIAQAPVAEARIEERAIQVDEARRTPLLRHLIEQGQWSRVLVFVATRYACDHVADKLRRAGIEAAAFHGDASQGARMRTLSEFKSGRLKVLVATDLGGRGIDIARLPVVVNYDLPRSAVDYVHRIGRTGRAGETGLAVSFLGESAESHFRLIEKRQGRRVPREQVQGFEPTQAPVAVVADPHGGVKGRRPSKKDKLRAAAAGHTAAPMAAHSVAHSVAHPAGHPAATAATSAAMDAATTASTPAVTTAAITATATAARATNKKADPGAQ